MNTIAELRKALKPLGYGIKTKSLSWGPHATYFRIHDKVELTGNVFTPETLAEWLPLFDWIRKNVETLRDLRQKTGTVGLLASILKS
jgi:hypothetical protein